MYYENTDEGTYKHIITVVQGSSGPRGPGKSSRTNSDRGRSRGHYTNASSVAWPPQKHGRLRTCVCVGVDVCTCVKFNDCLIISLGRGQAVAYNYRSP